MTLWQVTELMEYWADHPPAHICAAIQIGWKPRPKSAAQSLDQFFTEMTGQSLPG